MIGTADETSWFNAAKRWDYLKNKSDYLVYPKIIQSHFKGEYDLTIQGERPLLNAASILRLSKVQTCINVQKLTSIIDSYFNQDQNLLKIIKISGLDEATL